jgi:predicted transcriptional regulator
MIAIITIITHVEITQAPDRTSHAAGTAHFIRLLLKNYAIIVSNRFMQIPAPEEIREARKNKNLTQSKLAERAGVSQPLIARIEGENVDPTIDTLYTIVSVLNDSSSELGQEEVKISMPSVLEDARKQTGYTQGELAEVAGVSQPLISRIERQDVNPRASTLRKLFNHLDTSPDTDDDEKSKQSTTELNLAEKIEWELENTEEASSQSASEGNKSSTDGNECCSQCGSDLSLYPDPNYCPECGATI